MARGERVLVANGAPIYWQTAGLNGTYAPLGGSQYASNPGTTVKLVSAGGSPEYNVSGV